MNILEKKRKKMVALEAKLAELKAEEKALIKFESFCTALLENLQKNNIDFSKLDMSALTTLIIANADKLKIETPMEEISHNIEQEDDITFEDAYQNDF